VIWARDEADDEVKAFLVEKGTPGFETTKMEHKIALRAVQNADITLADVEVRENARLQNATRERARSTRSSWDWRSRASRRSPGRTSSVCGRERS